MKEPVQEMPPDLARRTRRRVLRAVAVLLIAGPILYVAIFAIARQQFQAANRRTLLNADGEAAKRAAWWVADGKKTHYAATIREALSRKDITDDYRESLVYTLGRLGDQPATPLLRSVLATSANGFVRQSAWLALARIDPNSFYAALREQPERDDWDRLGIAQARVHLAENEGVDSLLRLARTDDINLRQIACRSLARMVRPDLDAAGRWPVIFDPRPGEIWTDEQIDLVAGRVASVDVAAVRADTLKHAEAAQGVRKNVRRVASGRDHIARVLFWRSSSSAPDTSELR